MRDFGHVGWSPDYGSDSALRRAFKRARELGPGVGGIDCHSCGEQLIVLAGEPPKEWKWSEDGWQCPECAGE